eukprot:CAMPEP_0194064120 /NCGR_PEP_ID=MMETSP0009_2-20130614/82198_1 /TAXON_ID=210454 /ORGANISM="Grammatophora oceanica, Strain CCMP 410" /LENGTH=94 /DNA_ID=CAMNT_0038716503 /DNA_START=185 /DNA_END=465 /DNA_ORIENTATION=+
MNSWQAREIVLSWRATPTVEEEPIAVRGLSVRHIVANSIKFEGGSLARDNATKLLERFLGQGFDPTNTWDALGLSSVAQAELSGVIEEHMLVKL